MCVVCLTVFCRCVGVPSGGVCLFVSSCVCPCVCSRVFFVIFTSVIVIFKRFDEHSLVISIVLFVDVRVSSCVSGC